MNIKFDEKGLVTAVVQHAKTGEVLMVAYMNRQTLNTTIETKKATFWSRSRQEVWVKGATSGNYLNVTEILVDCDEDCLLIKAIPEGSACHTGKRSCFYRKIEDGEEKEIELTEDLSYILKEEQQTIIDRKKSPQEGSYTNYLFDKGDDKILKKVGEEAAEVVIAGKNRNKDEIKYEVADLMYHLSVMLVHNDMTWEDIYEEIKNRK